MKVEAVEININLAGQERGEKYEYVADDFPVIEGSDFGVLSIIVKSGGMEGHTTHNYIAPYHGSLISIGTVQTSMHLGRVEDVSVRRNKELEGGRLNRLLLRILAYNPRATVDARNAYKVSALLLLGQGQFLSSDEGARLAVLCENKELLGDPVILKKIKQVIGVGACSDAERSEIYKRYVVSEKAHFFNSPAPGNISKAYLIKGDEAILLRASENGHYWFVAYESTGGRETKKWIRCEDINYCQTH